MLVVRSGRPMLPLRHDVQSLQRNDERAGDPRPVRHQEFTEPAGLRRHLSRPANGRCLRARRRAPERGFTKRPINNVRAETIDEKAMWKKAFAERRCILPANWFVEWKGPKGKKVKYAFSMPDGEPYGTAGVWEFYKGDGDEPSLACSMVVGPPNELVADYHDRMPAILLPDDYGAWLAEPRKDLLRAYEGELKVEAL